MKMRQGKASLSAPSKALEQAVLARTLRHDGHPVLRWNVSNVAVDVDNAGNIQPSKAKSTERIDGVVALVMALDAMHRDSAAPAPTYDLIRVRRAVMTQTPWSAAARPDRRLRREVLRSRCRRKHYDALVVRRAPRGADECPGDDSGGRSTRRITGA